MSQQPEHVRRNEEFWDRQAQEYAGPGERAWARDEPVWGVWRVPESQLELFPASLAGQDAIVIRPIMHLALSYDHRAVDGAPANGFLHRVKELLEEAEFDL